MSAQPIPSPLPRLVRHATRMPPRRKARSLVVSAAPRRRGRPPCQSAVFDLPMPSVTDFITWSKAAASIIDQQDKLTGFVCLRLFASHCDCPVQLATLGTWVSRLLIQRHVIEGVGSVAEISQRFDRVIPSGLLRVVLKQTTPPISRPSASVRAGIVELGRLYRKGR